MSNSKSLHNFSLPQLKWAHSNHRVRRRSSQETHHFQSNTVGQPPPIVSVHADSNSAETTIPDSSNPSNLPCLKSVSFSSMQQQENSPEDLEKSKEDGVEDIDGSEVDEFRPWKLRPRKAFSILATSSRNSEKLIEDKTTRRKNRDGSSGGYIAPKSKRLKGSMAVVSGQVLGQWQSRSDRQRKGSDGKNRLWISLSREEIEEDVYSLTGSRPARRPKIRSKIVQKQLDHVFPGLYLVGMTVDYYRLLVSKATRAEFQAINS